MIDIDSALDRYLPKASEEPKILHKAMHYSVFSGGKRVRPTIAIEICKACGGKYMAAIAAACAIELVHTYSLIHDDLPSMDDDDFRRGKPSCHKVFGEANAILAGDALLTLAFNIVSREYEPKIAVMMTRQLSEAIGTKGMVGGQALDIEFKNIKKDKKTAIKINRLKTSKLFEASAILGAMAAGAGSGRVKAAAYFGAYLGEAFQMVDDILDGEGALSRKDAQALTASSKKALRVFGKNAGSLIKISDLVLNRKK
ncbi:MAG: polyprenyl synthetase family protein [Candidatus Omnitrophota bacterium]